MSRTNTASKLQRQSYDEPDERREPDRTTLDVVRLGGITSARATFQPGWSWSECIRPVAGTDTCQNRHVGVVTSGRLEVTHGDESMELGPGDAYVIEPGHDARVLGDEPFVGFEFETLAAETFGAPAE